MKATLSRLLCAAAGAALMFNLAASAAVPRPAEVPTKPTVVLVHGAFAGSSSWNQVAGDLRAQGYPVIAAANPLRGVRSDAASVAAIAASLPGPVVLVGHSYGGSVISAAADGLPNVKALVFVAAFAPQPGESAVDLSTRFPGSTLAQALAMPVALPDGTKDLYIQQERFHDQFASDLPPAAARLMAVTQRPIAEAALAEPAPAAAWRRLPSWFVYGDSDRNIPAVALDFMAQRARARGSVVVPGASHVVMVSRPDVVSRVIVEAAEATSPQR